MPEHSLASYKAGRGSSAALAPAGEGAPVNAVPTLAVVERLDAGDLDAAVALVVDAGLPLVLNCGVGCECERASSTSFMFCSAPVTRAEAARRCAMAGGTLVSVEDEAKERWLRERMLATVAVDAFWLGGTDSEQEGVWRWDDGRVFFDQTGDAAALMAFAPWDVDQPNDVMGEDCSLSTAAGWRDLDCGDELAFACQG